MQFQAVLVPVHQDHVPGDSNLKMDGGGDLHVRTRCVDLGNCFKYILLAEAKRPDETLTHDQHFIFSIPVHVCEPEAARLQAAEQASTGTRIGVELVKFAFRTLNQDDEGLEGDFKE